jgi:C4-dicarboxylate-specific signal transduction histidine kinase
MFGTIQDVTERKAGGEKTWRERAAIPRSQMELAHVNRVTTMGQLTASIAHEVSQPIGAVVINARPD